MNPAGRARRDASDAGGAALAALALTTLIEATTAPGPLALVVHPLYLLTLVGAALLATFAVRRLRGLRALHATALVTATFALQLVLMVAWGMGASWVLVARG